MLCSVLVNIDQRKKVIQFFCRVSENIIFSKDVEKYHKSKYLTRNYEKRSYYN